MKRKVNFELLRILAMLMIVTLHYLDKGRVLSDLKQPMGVWGHSVWFVEALCILAVNVYVLISGYLGYKNEFRLYKVTGFIKKVWFYSVFLTIIALMAGLWKWESFGMYGAIDALLPLSTNRYWFATSFFVLMLLMPLLNKGIAQLEQKQFRILILIAVLFFSVTKTFIPYQFPHDNAGYDVMWFVVLYLTGAYFGKYGFNILNSVGKALICVLLSVGCIWGVRTAAHILYLKTGKAESFLYSAYDYNSLWVYAGAIGVLALFSLVNIKEGTVAAVIRKVAVASFGVYLIHEHPAFRYEWPEWFKVSSYADNALLPVHLVFTVIVVFAVCSVMELIRIMIAARLSKCYNNMISKKRMKMHDTF